MEKNLLPIAFWVLFLGGLFGVAMGMVGYFGGKTPAEYGVMGIGGGAFLVWSAVVALIRSKLA
jgi:hypothetical protein